MPKLIQRCLALTLLIAISLPAWATVHMPTGEFRTHHVDLRVKVLGGQVKVDRTWKADNLNQGEYSWHVNPAWADLSFKMDPIDGVPRTIIRAGAKFKRGGNDVYIWHRDYFIRAQTDADGDTVGWRWYDRDGNWITYDTDGTITAYGDRTGTTVTFERDGQGRINRLLDADGNEILSYHWSGGHVTKITDRAGRSVSYHYSNDKLTKFTDVRGHDWQYAYSGGLMSTITNPAGGTTKIDYRGNRAVRVTDALGNATTYEYAYDRVQRIYTVVKRDPKGRRIERHYDRDGVLLYTERGNRVSYRLIKDGDHVETAVNERGGRTRTVFDANRNPVKVVYPDGTSVTSQYDADNNLLRHTDERGTVTDYEYNDRGLVTKETEAVGEPEQRVTTYSWNDAGLRTSKTVHATHGGDDATTHWVYDAYGNVKKQTDPEGHATTYTHGVTGGVLTRTDALDHTWTTERDAAGQVIKREDPLGLAVTIAYDKMGRRTAVTDALGHATHYAYDALGHLLKTTDPLGHSRSSTWSSTGQRLTQTNAVDETTTYAYDRYGRLTTITDPAGNVIKMEYGTAKDGLAGLLTATVYPTYREEYKYDPRGRRTRVIRVLPAHDGEPAQRLVTKVGYDGTGNRISSTDPAGHTTLYEYDALGHRIQTTDALGHKTHYAYDARDNLVAVTDANDHTHHFTYSLTDRVLSEARPSGETIHYQYDAAGRLLDRTSPSGNKRKYTYDPAGRQIKERLYAPGAADSEQTITYQYDANNQLIAYAQSGDTHSAATYSYDANGQRTGQEVTYGEGQGAFTLTTATSWGATGHKTGFTYPDGTHISYSYTANGQPKTASLPGNASEPITWQSYQWRQPTRITMPGAVRTMRYDGLMRPKEIKSQAIGSGTQKAPAGDIIMDYAYSYNKAGNITERTTNKGTWAYTYDAVDRLTGATPPEALQRDPANPQPNKLPVEHYSYDPLGNRMSSHHQPGPWRYNKDNQLLDWGLNGEHHSYTYNADGATSEVITGRPPATTTRKYQYNAAERLTKVKEADAPIATYRYDPMGRRIKKITAAGTTWFLYSPQGLIAEVDPSGTPTRYYGWKPNGTWGTDPLWLADRAGGDWQVSLYHNDHLGTPQRLTDTAGNIVWSGRSEAFGKTEVVVDVVDNPLRFPGQYYNRLSGSDYNYFRMYLPEAGRFTSRDYFGVPITKNQYIYVISNPINFIDPNGRQKLEIEEVKIEARARGRARYYRWRRRAEAAREQGVRPPEYNPWEDVDRVFLNGTRGLTRAYNLAKRTRFMQKFETYRSHFPSDCYVECSITYQVVMTWSGLVPINAWVSCPGAPVMADTRASFVTFRKGGLGTRPLCTTDCKYRG